MFDGRRSSNEDGADSKSKLVVVSPSATVSLFKGAASYSGATSLTALPVVSMNDNASAHNEASPANACSGARLPLIRRRRCFTVPCPPPPPPARASVTTAWVPVNPTVCPCPLSSSVMSLGAPEWPVILSRRRRDVSRPRTMHRNQRLLSILICIT